MGIFATAGAQVYIGTPKAAQSGNFIASNFNGQSWVAIGWLENVGGFGDESSEITFDAIGEGRTQKLKGVRNAGNMELVMGIDYADPGQISLRAAEGSNLDFAFRIIFNDKPQGGTSGSIRYFIGKVMTARETLDTANSVMRLNATVAINSNIVRVNAV